MRNRKSEREQRAANALNLVPSNSAKALVTDTTTTILIACVVIVRIHRHTFTQSVCVTEMRQLSLMQKGNVNQTIKSK